MDGRSRKSNFAKDVKVNNTLEEADRLTKAVHTIASKGVARHA